MRKLYLYIFSTQSTKFHNCLLTSISISFSITIFSPLLDFAVSSKKRIDFYNSAWDPVTEAGHHFTSLSALAYDEIGQIIYFNDQDNEDGTIYSLALSNDSNHRIRQVIEKTQDERIQGMAFDPVDRTLYWTDAINKLIYRANVDHDNKPEILIKLNDTHMPYGIAVDVCRRQLYWTNFVEGGNSTIERSALDGTDRKTLIETNIYFPSGIAVDQYAKRIFWVDDLQGVHYAIESAALDGTDRQMIVQEQFAIPFNIAVDQFNLYWTDVENGELSSNLNLSHSLSFLILTHIQCNFNFIQITYGESVRMPPTHERVKTIKMQRNRPLCMTSKMTSTQKALSYDIAIY